MFLPIVVMYVLYSNVCGDQVIFEILAFIIKTCFNL